MATTADRPGQRAHQGEDFDRHPAGVDAGQLGRFGVAAHGIDVATKAGATHQDSHGDADGDQDQDRDREAVADKQAVWWNLDAFGLGIAS